MKMPRQLEEKPNFPHLKKHGRSLDVSVSFRRDFDELDFSFLIILKRKIESSYYMIINNIRYVI